MRLKLDENIPVDLVDALSALGHDVDTVPHIKSAVHHGVLLVRLNTASRRNLIERITAIFRDESVESWVGCLVVVTERKIRIRRPGQ